MIESKLTFLDKQVEVLFGDSIVLPENPFRLIPEILDTVGMNVPVHIAFDVVDDFVN